MIKRTKNGKIANLQSFFLVSRISQEPDDLQTKLTAKCWPFLQGLYIRIDNTPVKHKNCCNIFLCNKNILEYFMHAYSN